MARLSSDASDPDDYKPPFYWRASSLWAYVAKSKCGPLEPVGTDDQKKHQDILEGLEKIDAETKKELPVIDPEKYQAK